MWNTITKVYFQGFFFKSHKNKIQKNVLTFHKIACEDKEEACEDKSHKQKNISIDDNVLLVLFAVYSRWHPVFPPR